MIDPETNPNIVEQIREAKKGNAILFGSNREIRRLPQYLHEGEEVYSISTGSPGKNKGRGIIVATNERIMFIRDGWIFRTVQDFPYETVSSVEFKTGVFFGTLILYGKGDETQYEWVGRNSGAKFARLARKLSSEAKRYMTSPREYTAPTPVQAAPAQDFSQPKYVQDLQKIQNLLDQKLISLDDYEIKKQEIISRI